MADLLAMLDGLEANDPVDKVKILRAPFGYPGGKSRIVEQIIPLLPTTGRYIEVFGGSAAVLLGKPKSTFEVYNDRYGGVVAFYRCLQNPHKMDKLIERLEYTIHAREEWHQCKTTWQDHLVDDVERAARWYYMMRYSFAGKGGCFGRSTSDKSILSGKIQQSLECFPAVHERMKRVQIENLDWRQCMADYDHPDTVFYLDPPYLECSDNTYKAMGGPDSLTVDMHSELIDMVFKCKGFVALSGYDSKLYNGYDWDSVHEWDVYISMTGMTTEREAERGTRKEVLYIKEAH